MQRAEEQTRRFVEELRLACDAAGLTQRDLARIVGLSPAEISRILSGRVVPRIDAAHRLVAATGHRLWLNVVPDSGPRLRDSGQLSIAEVIRAEAHPSWRVRLELPVGRAPDRRAVDMLMDKPSAAAAIEIERWLRDIQAKLRAAQLKREALAEHLERRVDLIVAAPDTRAARLALAPHASLIRAALPVTSRRAWAAIRSGEPIGGDALLWVRRTKSHG
jgi:transcriptional regulator with XRE-family HTH domain